MSEMISRTLMYQWDRAKVQRVQKLRYRQALIFGWDVRPWFWAFEERVRTRRLDVLGGQLKPEDLEHIASTYKVTPQALMMPELQPRILAGLLSKHSRGRMLPVKYPYKCYEGPKCDFLFVGDCYPEPRFRSIQTSNWFIVERRRNKQWLENVALTRYYHHVGLLSMSANFRRLLSHPR